MGFFSRLIVRFLNSSHFKVEESWLNGLVISDQYGDKGLILCCIDHDQSQYVLKIVSTFSKEKKIEVNKIVEDNDELENNLKKTNIKTIQINDEEEEDDQLISYDSYEDEGESDEEESEDDQKKDFFDQELEIDYEKYAYIPEEENSIPVGKTINIVYQKPIQKPMGIVESIKLNSQRYSQNVISNIHPTISPQMEKKTKKSSIQFDPVSKLSLIPKFSLNAKLNIAGFARCLVSYSGNEKEISLKEGEIIQVISEENLIGRLAGTTNIGKFQKEHVDFFNSPETMYSSEWKQFYPKKNTWLPVPENTKEIIEKCFLKFCTVGEPKKRTIDEYEVDLIHMKISGKFSTTSERETYQLTRDERQKLVFTMSDYKTILENILFFLEETVIKELYSEVHISDEIKDFVENSKVIYSDISNVLDKIKSAEIQLLNYDKPQILDFYSNVKNVKSFLLSNFLFLIKIFCYYNFLFRI